MTDSLIRRHDKDGITTLTLSSPQTLNALSTPMLMALAESFAACAIDDRVRVVILAAEGKAFSAGHDLKEMQSFRSAPDGGEAQFHALFDHCADVMQQIAAMPQPVIAQVQGVATAAGCQLACTCDLIVASETARFGVNGINLGLFCATPAVALTRRLAPGAAFELLTTGEFLSAERAHAMGVVNRLAPPDHLAEETHRLAATIAAKDPAAIRLGKRAFQAQLGKPLRDAYAVAGSIMVENVMLPDTAEGIQAFIERRPKA
ncbi:MAG: enoyl-CoA hydratase [Tabrizicola sp.]|uniref:enoyl-CoA hydratase n=1 Tax=Tabrizicola sp. TaxID=2005166 RepID=UPI002ABAEB02|nr:enoyl-CoA hydratase [Tabrizicola sp.]MDZ4088025.1 enoyl-CoA hydratase [Tabrizicola sp.]